MPESAYDKYNGSSSEEEEESDEEVVLPRRTQQFRVASNPAEAKAAILSDIRSMADHQQANETIVTEIKQSEKTDEEKRALEQRQQMLQQQEQAKAQQAAALQAAATKMAAATGGANQGEEYAHQMEEEMRRKAEAARKQAEEERKIAEERNAQLKAQQEAALKAMQEQVKKAQEEALQKAREAKAKAEAEAKAKAEKAKLEAEQRAKAEAQAKAAQAKAQAEAQAKAAQAKALAEAQAKAAQAKAQAELAAKKSQQEALERAQKAKLEAEQKAKLLQQTPATKVSGAQTGAASTTPVPPKTAPITPPSMTKQPGMPTQQTVNKAAPTVPAKTGPQVPAKPITPVAGKPTPTGPPTAMKTKPDPIPINQNEPIKTVPRVPGKVTNPMPIEPKQPQQRPFEPISKNTALRQTAKMQEEALAQEPSRPTKGIHAVKPNIGLNDVRERFVEKEEPPVTKQSVKPASVLTGASRWEEQSAQRQLAANTMGMDGPVPAAVRLQDDSCWQTQHRVPPEIHPPQIGKISIPEFNDLHEVRRTVIVNKPSYQKVKWNEFPEEITPEIGSAPKVQTQEWKPINQENVDVQRNQFQPSKISRVWPPPQEEIVKSTEPVRVIKAGDDCGWIHQDTGEVVKSTVWQRNSKIDKVWPPPEGDVAVHGYQGPQHMSSVQWPPAESEQHEREQVEVLQKHIPARKADYQWPPPPPVYQVVNGDISSTDATSIAATGSKTITVPSGEKTSATRTTTTTTITSTKRMIPNPGQFQQQQQQQPIQVVKAK